MVRVINVETREQGMSELEPAHLSLMLEYYRLSSCAENSDQEMDRIVEILELAESDHILSLLTDKVDIFIAKKMNLLSHEALRNLNNQLYGLIEKLNINRSGPYLGCWPKIE